MPETAAEAKFAAEIPAPGDSLHILDNPNRLDVLWVYTAASVRQLGRINLGQTMEGPDPDVLIVQAPLADGRGRRAVLNDRGELVGVVSGKTGPQQQVAFCLTTAEVRGFLDDNRLRWEPDSAAALVRRGDVFLKARQYARATTDFDAALRLDPITPRPWRARPGRLPSGRRAMRPCATAGRRSKRPRRWPPPTAGAAALGRKGDPRKAVADCDAALAARRAIRPGPCRPRRRLPPARRLRPALADCDEAVWLDRIAVRLTSIVERFLRIKASRTRRSPITRGRCNSTNIWRTPSGAAATPSGSRATWRRPWRTTTRRWRPSRRRGGVARPRPVPGGEGRHEAALAAFDAA